MGQKEKLIARLRSMPRDFTYSEAESLLKYLHFHIDKGGKTSGSRVKFVKDGKITIYLHKPHPRKELLEYQLKDILRILEEEGLI